MKDTRPLRPANELECRLYDDLLAQVPEFMAQHAIKDIQHGGKPLQKLALRVEHVIEQVGFVQQSDALYVAHEPDILDERVDLNTFMHCAIALQRVALVLRSAGWKGQKLNGFA